MGQGTRHDVFERVCRAVETREWASWLGHMVATVERTAAQSTWFFREML
jgi:hypothetical protein